MGRVHGEASRRFQIKRRATSERGSAPPLHVGVPPREFDGLPSAGAAPAVRTGTQESEGTDHPLIPARDGGLIGERAIEREIEPRREFLALLGSARVAHVGHAIRVLTEVPSDRFRGFRRKSVLRGRLGCAGCYYRPRMAGTLVTHALEPRLIVRPTSIAPRLAGNVVGRGIDSCSVGYQYHQIRNRRESWRRSSEPRAESPFLASNCQI